MATITFEYDAKSKVARKAIDLLVSSGIFKTMSEDVSLSDDNKKDLKLTLKNKNFKIETLNAVIKD